MKRRHFAHSAGMHGHSRGTGRETVRGYSFAGCCLVAAVILTGVFIGARLASGAGNAASGSFGILLEQMFVKDSASKGFVHLFLSSFFPSALIICASYALGLCAAGLPGQIAAALYKGAGIGMSMGCIYIKYGLKGFVICALFILPWAVITSLAVIMACYEGIRFSLLVARCLLPSGGRNLFNEFRAYNARYLTCFLLVLAASAVEALSSMAFSVLFLS